MTELVSGQGAACYGQDPENGFCYVVYPDSHRGFCGFPCQDVPVFSFRSEKGRRGWNLGNHGCFRESLHSCALRVFDMHGQKVEVPYVQRVASRVALVFQEDVLAVGYQAPFPSESLAVQGSADVFHPAFYFAVAAERLPCLVERERFHQADDRLGIVSERRLHQADAFFGSWAAKRRCQNDMVVSCRTDSYGEGEQLLVEEIYALVRVDTSQSGKFPAQVFDQEQGLFIVFFMNHHDLIAGVVLLKPEYKILLEGFGVVLPG